MNCRNSATPTPRRTWGWLKAGLLSAAMALFSTAQAQITAYGRTVLSGQTYTQIAGGTVINTDAQLTHATLGSTSDDGGVTVTLPFTFTYDGNPFTEVTFCTNGWIGMGPQTGVTATQGRTAGNLFSTTVPNNTIGGWFGDGNANFTQGGSMVHGTVDSDVYAFEWRNATGNSFNASATVLINYMIKLYGPASASPGRIELLYGTTAGTITTGRSNGIEDATGGTNHYINALNGLSNSTTTNSTWPGNGNGYRFDAPVPCAAVTGGTATASVLSGCASIASSTLSVASAPLSGVTYQWYSGPAGGPWTTALGTTATQAVSALTTTTGYVRVTTCANDASQATSSEVVLTVHTIPTVTVTPSSITSCSGTPQVLSASGATTYTWSPATQLSANTGDVVTATATATRTYTVTGTDANGCNATATAAITVLLAPEGLTVTPANAAICAGESIALNATGGGANGSSVITTSTTSTTSGTTAYYSPFDTYFGNKRIQYIIRASELTAAGMSAGTPLNSLSFNVVTLPSTNIALQAFTLKIGHTANTDAATWAPEVLATVFGPVAYTQVTGANTLPFASNFVWDGSSNVVVEVCHENNTGTGTCSSGTCYVNSSTVSMHTASFTPAARFFRQDTNGACGNTGVSTGTPVLRPVMTFGVPLVSTYAWTPATGLDVTTGTSVTASPTTGTTYTVTATLPNGCTATATSAITVGEPLVASIEASALSFCTGGSVTITANVSGGGQPYEYLWSNDAETASITVNTPGTYYYMVVDACGDDVLSGEVTITENALPVVTVDPSSAPSCDGAAVTLNAAGASSYSWAPATGLSSTTGATVNANPAASTNYVVTGTDPNGCTNTAVAVVAVSTSPVVLDVTADPATICEGSTSQLEVVLPPVVPYCTTIAITNVESISLVQFAGINNATACGIGAAGGTALEDYTAMVAEVTAGTSYPITVSGTTDGSFTNHFTAFFDFDQNGTFESSFVIGSINNTTCTANATSNILIPTSALNGSSRMRIVKNFNTSPTNPCGTYSYGQAEDYTINVTGGGSNSIAWSPAATLSNATIANPVASPEATTTYEVVVTNGAGCSTTEEVTVTIGTPAPPAVEVTAGSNGFCTGGSLVLTADLTGGCAPFTYSWSDGTNVIGSSSTQTVNAAGSYTVTVTDVNSNTATSTAFAVTENMNPAITINASASAICGSGSVDLTASGADTFVWSPATGLSATTGNAVIATVSSTSTYTATGTNTATGCVGSNTVTITVNPVPLAPSPTATPATICLGGTSQLSGAASASAYCTTFAITNTVEAISLVQFADINNASACVVGPGAGGSLEDFTAIVGNVVAGSSYPITVSGHTDGSFTNHFRAFFDFDQNGSFETSFVIGSIISSTCNVNATNNILIPASALNGSTRMRIVKNFSTSPTDACGSYAYGQAEDYTINVTGGVGADTYSWDNASTLDNASIANPVASPVETTTYTVTRTNGFGCSSTGTVTVNVSQPADAGVNGTLSLCNVGAPVALETGLSGTPDAGGVWTGPDDMAHSGTIDPSVDAAGSYTYTVTAASPCPAVSATVTVSIDAATIWYADADGDGYGDPNAPMAECGQPEGYVANYLDNCPEDGGKRDPGVCGCGTPDTDTDGDGIADCVDTCPSTPGQVGSTCDDGDPNTIGDVLNSDCECAGTVPTACEGNSVALLLSTDANGSQTSWEIIPQGGGTALCTGSGYASNTTITETCCLPNGCYQLRVLDSFGDGMTTGGYTLVNASNQRIIDNVGNGAGFTSVSQVGLGLGFCLPIGNDRMSAGSCDRLNLLSNAILQAEPNPFVSAQWQVGTQTDDGYQFWIFDPNGSYSRRVFVSHATANTGGPFGATRASYLNLATLVTSPVPQYKLLNIRVRSMVNGVYSEFGPACLFKIDPATECQLTQLTTTGTPSISCGAVNIPLPGGLIHANEVAGANRYQFEFTAPGYARRIASNTRTLTLTNWVTLPLTCGTTYNVRVRVSFNGGGTYCAFGPVCAITTQACGRPANLTTRMDEVAETEFSIWPNPNRGDLLNVRVDRFNAPVETVVVDVMDMFGKRVMGRTIAVDNGPLNTVLELDSHLASGVYLVHITAGEQTLVKRLVVQK